MADDGNNNGNSEQIGNYYCRGTFRVCRHFSLWIYCFVQIELIAGTSEVHVRVSIRFYGPGKRVQQMMLITISDDYNRIIM